MSKKNGFGKFVLFTAAVGAAAAGAYYYLTKREDELSDDFDDEFDDFDDFEDEEISSDTKMSSRKYVDITEGKSADKSDDTDSEESVSDVIKEPEGESEEFFDDEK